MEKASIEENWSEAVEDLAAAGDIDGAISLLESMASNLETISCSTSSSGSQLQLASVLTDLAKLYSSKGFSLKSDDLQSRVSLIKQRAFHVRPSGDVKALQDLKEEKDSLGRVDSSRNKGDAENPTSMPPDAAPDSLSDDDWEAMADRAPDELLPTQSLSRVSQLALEDPKTPSPKRRGRGTFSYEKDKLYSDKLSENSFNGVDVEIKDCNSEENTDVRKLIYGTCHALVLADFPPSTRTTDLEKLFVDFKYQEFAIRWVNDTIALAVFRTPSTALEALNCIQCPFTVRILAEDDTLLQSIKTRDLEPLRQRPTTSTRAAQRLIAQGMGLRLPSAGFGSRELRKQEDARRVRIITRQKLRDEAWGNDD